VRASIRGWREYLRDPAPAHAAISKLNPALTPDWMEFSWKAMRDGNFVTGQDASGAEIGQMDPMRWRTMYEQLLALQVITQKFDPSSAYTLQFVQSSATSQATATSQAVETNGPQVSHQN
jgi:NitT/TauT family transport system substrate-binding protein